MKGVELFVVVLVVATALGAIGYMLAPSGISGLQTFNAPPSQVFSSATVDAVPFTLDLNEAFFDSEGESLMYAVDDALAFVDGNILTFTPAPDFSGEYVVTITVSDGTNTIAKPFTLIGSIVVSQIQTPLEAPTPAVETPLRGTIEPPAFILPPTQTEELSTQISAPSAETGISSDKSISVACTSCGDCTTCLGTVGQTCTLTGDITSATDCINSPVANTTLDCAGFSLTYNTGGGATDFGIATGSVSGLTITNCNVIDGSTAGTNGFGLIMTGTSNSTVQGNTFRANGSSGNRGIELSGTSAVNVYNNNIYAEGTAGANTALNISGSNFSGEVTGNVLYAEGSGSTNFGLQLGVIGPLWFSNNTIEMGGVKASAGLINTTLNQNGINGSVNINGVSGSIITGNLIENNTIAGSVALGALGTLSGNFSDNKIYQNTITTTGIGVTVGTTNFTSIINNDITGATGITLSELSLVTTLDDNTIVVTGNGEGLDMRRPTLSSSFSFAAAFGNNITNSNTINGLDLLYLGGTGSSPACPNGTTITTPAANHIHFIGCDDIILEDWTTFDAVTIIASTDIHMRRLTMRSGLDINGTNIVLHNSTITSNKTRSNDGSLIDGSNIYLENNTFNFTSTNQVFGIYSTGTEYSIRNNTFVVRGASVPVGIETNGDRYTIVNNSINDFATTDGSAFGLDWGASNSVIENNTILANGSNGCCNEAMDVSSGSNVTVRGNRFTADDDGTGGPCCNYGISGALESWNIDSNTMTVNGSGSSNEAVIVSGSNVVVQNNTILLQGTDGDHSGVRVSGTRSNQSITNNFISILGIGADTANYGVLFGSVDTANVTNNIVTVRGTGTNHGGLRFSSGTRVTAQNNTITVNGTNSRGIWLTSTSNHNLIVNNTVSTSNGATYALSIEAAQTNNSFVNNTLNDTTHWINTLAGSTTQFNNTEFRTTSGAVNITNFTLSGASTIARNVITVTSNLSFVNTTNVSSLNSSGAITLTGLAFADAQPLIDTDDDGVFASCISPECDEVSYTGGVFVFNTSHFTSHSSTETSATCPLEVTTTTTLAENLTCPATAVNINADNLVLDCAGYNISYANSAEGAGINATDRTNVTLQNCIILMTNTSSSNSPGILFQNTQNSTVQNNSLNVSGSGGNGVLLNLSLGIIVANTSSTSNDSAGVLVFQTNDSQILNVTARSTTGNAFFVSGALNVTVANSSANSTSGNGIQLTSSNYSTLSANTFNGSTGIGLISSANNTIENNYAFAGSGIGLSSSSQNNLTNNTAAASTSYGIGLSDSNDVRLINNTGTSAVSGGISASGARNVVVGNLGRSTSQIGLGVSGGQNQTFANNTATSQSNTALYFNVVSGSNITNNTAYSDSGTALFLDFGTFNNTYTSTVLESNATWLFSQADVALNMTDTSFRATTGKIRYPSNFSVPNATQIDQPRLNIISNRTFANSTHLPFLNTTGEITLNSIAFTNPEPLIDVNDDGVFALCSSPECDEVSYTGGVFVFNTSHFTAHASRETSAGPVVINSSDGSGAIGNNASDNESLTVFITTTGAVKNITDWRISAVSIALANLPFEGGSTNSSTQDYSTFGNDGTVQNATWNSTAGFDGAGAYDFNGSNAYIDLGSSASLNGRGPVSISAWVKTTGLNGDIVSKFGDADLNDSYVLRVNSAGQAMFSVSSAGFKSANGLSVINNGQYHHVMGVFTGTSIEIYVNGTLENSTAVTGSIDASNATVKIGRGGFNVSGFGGEFFNGTIDEVMIFNRSFSSTQVSQYYSDLLTYKTLTTIVADQTRAGEYWTVNVTPNNGTSDGTSLVSNTVTILGTILTATKTDSTDPVTSGSSFTYQINVTVTNSTASNVSVNETYPFGLGFVSSQPTPTSGNNYFALGDLSNTTFSVNVTLRVDIPVVTGYGNLVNISYNDADGFNQSLLVSESTAFLSTISCNSCENCTACLASQGVLCRATNAITAINTCINMTADNATFDCNGFELNYATTGLGAQVGVAAANRNNITVKNCIIRDTAAAGSGSVGVNFTNVDFSTIQDNNITTNGSLSNFGVRLNTGSTNNIVQRNRITSQATSFSNFAIYVLSGSNNTVIQQNILTPNGPSSGAVGVKGETTVFNTTVYNNTIRTSGTGVSNYGIAFDTGSTGNNTITFNSIITNSTSAGVTNDVGIRLVGSVHNIAANNTILTAGTSTNYGITLATPSCHNNSLINNTVNARGTTINNHGIRIEARCGDNRIERNSVTTYGTTGNDGIFGGAFDYNSVIKDNIVFASGSTTTNRGITAADTVNYTIMNNTVSTNGTSGNIGILVLRSNNTLVTNNSFQTRGTSGNIALHIDGNGRNNTVTHNRFAANGSTSDNVGISVADGSIINLTNNTITTNGTSSNHGIFFARTNHSVVDNNSVQTRGTTTANVGIAFNTNVRNHTVTRNVVVTNGTDNNFGIEFTTNANNNTASSNNITTGGAASNIGLRVVSTADNGTYSGNIISTLGTGNGNIGLQLDNAENNLLENNTISTAGINNSFGISIGTSSHNNDIRNNSIATSGTGEFNVGLTLGGSSYNRVVNNTVSARSAGRFNWGIDFSSGTYVNITSNRVSTNGTSQNQGIHVDFSGHNANVSGNRVVTDGSAGNNYGITIGGDSHNTTVEHNTVVTYGTTQGHGLRMTGYSNNSSFNNNTVSTFGTSSFGIVIGANAAGGGGGNPGGADISFFNNTRLVNVTQWISVFDSNASTHWNTTFENVNGSIALGNFSLGAALNVTKSELNIYNNTAYINTTSLSALNTTAEVMLVGLNTSTPRLIVDYNDDLSAEYCDSPQCELSSYTSGTLRFNVSSFTSYSSSGNMSVEKNDTPDPVTAGAQLNYTIYINNTGNDTLINTTAVENYPSDVVFDSSSPAPDTGNNTWFLGNITGLTSTTINITLNVSSALANGTVLNNSVNVTFANNEGINTSVVDTENTTVTAVVCPLDITTSTTLTENVTCPATAINVLADNVVLDCAGYTVNYSSLAVGFGINSTGRQNITVENCILVQNNASLAGSNGIALSDTNESTVFNITANLSSASRAMYVFQSHRNRIDQLLAQSAGSFTFTIEASDNNNVSNVSSTGSAIGVLLTSAGSSIFDNVSGISTTGTGFFVSQSNTNTLRNSSGLSNSGNAFFTHFSSGNDYTDSNFVTNTGAAMTFDTSANSNLFNRTTLRTNNTWISLTSAAGSENNFTNTVFENVSSGNINITANALFPASTSINLVNLRINPNATFLNSTNLSFLNTTAQVTLNGLNFTDPQIVVDFEDDGTFAICASPTCNETSYTGGVFAFNVSRFTSYAASETVSGLSCPYNVTADLNMTADQNCAATVFVISANNVTLDCAGYNIYFDNASGGTDQGVLVTARNNVTIKNCFISSAPTASNASNRRGINLIGSQNVTITNNTIRVNSTTVGNGIFVQTDASYPQSRDVTITNNTIIINGTSNQNRGIHLLSVPLTNTVANVTIANNSINARNTDNGGDIRTNRAANITVEDNILLSNGSSFFNSPIFMLNTAGAFIARNNITFGGTGVTNGAGIDLDGSVTNSTAVNNSILTLGAGGRAFGIRIEFSSRNNTIFNNTIRTGGGAENNFGITVTQEAQNNTISHNSIITNGTTNNIGIRLRFATGPDTTGNIIQDNIIVTDGTGTDNYGIMLEGVSNNTFVNNSIRTIGTGRDHGISIFGAASNSTFDRTVITAASANSYAIAIDNSSFVQFANSRLVNTAQWINQSNTSHNNFTNTTFETVQGSINLPATINISVFLNATENNLNITLNRSFMNSTNLSPLNRSGIVTLNGLGFADPQIVVDYEDDGTFATCASPTCNETSYTGGVFVFNVSSFTSYAASETVNASGCPVYVTADSVLGNNITCPATAIIINASNLVFDCAGYNISYAHNASGYGVNATGRTNVSIRNCNIVQGNSSITDNIAIYFDTVTSSSILNTTANATGNSSAGIHLTGSSLNTIANTSVYAQALLAAAFRIQTASNTNRIEDSVGFSGAQSGIIIATSTNNDVVRSNFTTFSGGAVELSGSSGNRFDTIVANDTSGTLGGAVLNFGTGTNNNFTNLILDEESGLGSIRFTSASTGNQITNATLYTAGNWIEISADSTGNTINQTTFERPDGSAYFYSNTTITPGTTATLTNVNISLNRTRINSTQLPYLNTTAQLTLRGLTFSDPRPAVDFEDDGTFMNCDSPQCDEVSYAGGTFVFNVTSFTSYAASESPQCPLNVTTSTTLAQNVTCPATAIQVQSDNLVLDCAGNTVIWDTAGTGNDSGIQIANRLNVTVQNCILVDSNALGQSGIGVNLTRTNESTIFNNTILTNGTSGNYGVYLVSSANNNTVQNNTIRTQGTSIFNDGVVTESFAGRNAILLNTISTNGTSNNEGVLLQASNNTIRGNIISTRGSSNANRGVRATGVVNVTIDNNSISTSGTDANFGVHLSTATDSHVTNNTIATTGTSSDSVGIFVDTSVLRNNVTGNIVSTNGTSGARGIVIQSFVIQPGSQNRVVNNSVRTTNGHGIQLISHASSNTVSDNFVNATGGGAVAIDITTNSDNNTLEGNNITSASSYGIQITSSTNSTFNNTFLNNPSRWISTAAGTTSNFSNTTFSEPFGSIALTNFTLIDVTDILKSGLSTTLNHSFLDSVNQSYLNSSGQITLNTLGFTDPRPRVDFEDDGTFTDCDAPQCIEVSFAGGVYVFNVSSFTSYAAQENLTFVINLSAEKADSPDPVARGSQLSYTITLNNTGNATAINVTVVENYPSGVVFVLGQPTPSGNDTFSVGDIAPNATFLINITVNVSSALTNGTILNNTVNVTFANSSGVNSSFNDSELTTVLGAPVLVSIKSDTPDPVVRGQQLNYSILLNNTGDDTAFNVTLTETYPAGVTLVTTQPAPSAGNNTFAIGTLAPNESFLVNITVTVGSNVANGTILTNSVNASFRNSTGGQAVSNDSETTTVLGIAALTVAKTDTPDPVNNGSVLSYTITVTNTGDETAYNVTAVDGYDVNITFNGSSPAPTSGNDTFLLGDLLPGASTTINITVNVSATMTSGVLNNTVNATFTNTSGVNETTNAFQATTVTTPAAPAVAASGGGGGGSNFFRTANVTREEPRQPVPISFPTVAPSSTPVSREIPAETPVVTEQTSTPEPTLLPGESTQTSLAGQASSTSEEQAKASATSIAIFVLAAVLVLLFAPFALLKAKHSAQQNAAPRTSAAVLAPALRPSKPAKAAKPAKPVVKTAPAPKSKTAVTHDLKKLNSDVAAINKMLRDFDKKLKK